MLQKFSQERQARSENFFASQDIQSVEDVMQFFEGQTSVTKIQLGGEMNAIKTQATEEGFGDNFSLQPPAQAVSENVQGEKGNIQKHITEKAQQIKQKGQDIDQKRDEQQKSVEEGLDQNVLGRSFTALTGRVWGQLKEWKEMIIPSDKEKK